MTDADSKATSTTAKKQCRSGYLIILVVALLALIIAIVMPYCLLKKFTTYSTNTNRYVKNLQTSNSLLNKKLCQQRTLVTNLQQQLKQQTTRLDALAHAHRDYMNNQNVYAAVYLIRLANFNLVLVKRPNIALHMLEQADFLLNQSFDPSFMPLRKSINNNIMALKAANQFNLDTILLQLQSMSDALSKLSIASPTMEKASPKHILDKAAKQQSWRDHFASAWHDVGKLIIIRHHNKAIEPLLSPQQNAVLQQNLQLLFMQAQWAAMNRNNTLFQHSLKQLKHIISTAYSQQSASAQSLLNELNALASTNVNPELPDLGNSFKLAENLMTQIKASS